MFGPVNRHVVNRARVQRVIVDMVQFDAGRQRNRITQLVAVVRRGYAEAYLEVSVGSFRGAGAAALAAAAAKRPRILWLYYGKTI